jgi:alkylation response protein AidB-like acyl-CoA dehydrogenase
MSNKTSNNGLDTSLEYSAPLQDMAFLLNEVFPLASSDSLNEKSEESLKEEREEELFVLKQAAYFAEQELAPINSECDRQGCQLSDGQVSLPPCMKTAFQKYAQAGWMGLCMPEEWGGQNQSSRLGSFVSELLTSANHAFSMTPALTISACHALIAYGSDELKQNYLEKMISGQWTGTMCMTEAHCGSDLGLIRTSATANADGSYRLKGSKIFISAGSHDASDNIIHLVLARLKDSPISREGIKGLSLFLVPEKVLEKALQKSEEGGQWNKDNHVRCIGIEDKMGVHGNPTCSMSFENSQGYLIGEENKGINAMFAMMNEMRLGTSLQGIGLSERSFQKSLNYAQNRTQMRSLSGVKNPEIQADPLIVHPDVRRMLLTQKVFAEGGRALAQFCSQLMDETHQENANKENQQLLDMLTPIAKGFCTEVGLESASHAIQIHGGHSFIKETSVEQLYRDGRIATLYEGNSGIQALDLFGRKVLGTQGKSLMSFTKMMHVLGKENSHLSDDSEIATLLTTLKNYSKKWPEITMQVGAKAMKNPDEASTASFDYMMYSGYVVLAYFWAKMAITARLLLDKQVLDKPLVDDQPLEGEYSKELLENKIANTTFFLPASYQER